MRVRIPFLLFIVALWVNSGHSEKDDRYCRYVGLMFGRAGFCIKDEPCVYYASWFRIGDWRMCKGFDETYSCCLHRDTPANRNLVNIPAPPEITDVSPEQPHQCKGADKQDVFILLENSANVAADVFNKAKADIVDLLAHLNVGFDKTRVTIGTFAARRKTIAALDNKFSIAELQEKVNSEAKSMEVNPRPDKALRHLYRNLIKAENGDRAGVQNVVVLFASTGYQGSGVNARLIDFVITKLKEKNTKMHLVSLAPYLAVLPHRFPNPAQNLYYITKDEFSSTRLATKMCESVRILTVPIAQLPECGKADMYIVIDNSLQLTVAGFADVKQIAKDFIEALNVGMGETRIGIVPTDPTKMVCLDRYNDKKSLKDKIDELTQSEAETCTETQMETLQSNGFTVNCGDRPEIPNKVVFITRGNACKKNLLLLHHANLRAHHAIMYMLNVGDKYSNEVSNLADICETPKTLNFSGGMLKAVVCTGSENC